MVYFIGAGPGDVDLITVKGRDILTKADVVIYAGSLVAKEHMDYCKEEALIYNSAKMTLEEVIEVMDTNKDKTIVRLHTGDPSIYGAIKEQMDELDKLNIEYEVVPGVSSFVAAASAIKKEFTLPSVTQTVILTRVEGRTPVPETEDLEKLAQIGASMAIFLSISMIDKVVAKLRAGYGRNVPIAVIERATWDNERSIIGTLDDIADKVKIDEMRKEFLDNVSHELKTPIALVQGYAEGLKEGINDDPESMEFYCDVIMDEASKMNKLVKNLLTLNHLESGRDEIVMERFDLTALIQGVLSTMDIMIQQKEAKIIFEEEKPVYVWADEFKTEEVVTNYVSNALNHLEGEHEIEIKILKEESTVKVTVFNTGTPIPEEDIPKLWNKFFKVDKARTREYGGSGIGLSIVKAIMEGMNQKYGVVNFDNGVEFWFTLDRK